MDDWSLRDMDEFFHVSFEDLVDEVFHGAADD